MKRDCQKFMKWSKRNPEKYSEWNEKNPIKKYKNNRQNGKSQQTGNNNRRNDNFPVIISGNQTYGKRVQKTKERRKPRKRENGRKIN